MTPEVRAMAAALSHEELLEAYLQLHQRYEDLMLAMQNTAELYTQSNLSKEIIKLSRENKRLHEELPTSTRGVDK